MLKLEKNRIALIVIDLQNGVLDPEPTPFGRDQIIRQAAILGRAFAHADSPIILTTTDFSPGYADAPKGLADSPWGAPQDWPSFWLCDSCTGDRGASCGHSDC